MMLRISLKIVTDCSCTTEHCSTRFQKVTSLLPQQSKDFDFGVPAINFRPFRLLEKKDFHLLNIENIYKNVLNNACCVMRELSHLRQSASVINNIRELINTTPEDSSRLVLAAYKMFIDKYCAGKDTQPAIATAYRKIREHSKNAR